MDSGNLICTMHEEILGICREQLEELPPLNPKHLLSIPEYIRRSGTSRRRPRRPGTQVSGWRTGYFSTARLSSHWDSRG